MVKLIYFWLFKIESNAIQELVVPPWILSFYEVLDRPKQKHGRVVYIAEVLKHYPSTERNKFFVNYAYTIIEDISDFRHFEPDLNLFNQVPHIGFPFSSSA